MHVESNSLVHNSRGIFSEGYQQPRPQGAFPWPKPGKAPWVREGEGQFTTHASILRYVQKCTQLDSWLNDKYT